MTDRTNKIGSWEKHRQAGLLMLGLFLLECCLTGSGRIMLLGPLTLRMLLALTAGLAALPLFFRDIRGQIKKPVNWLVLAFCLYLVFAALRGRARGNNAEVWLLDVKGFLWIVLLPVTGILCVKDKDLRRLADLILLGGFLMGLLCFIGNLWFCLVPEHFDPTLHFIWKISWGNLSLNEYHTYRFFGKSGLFMIPAAGLALKRFILAESGRPKLKYGIAFFFIGSGLLFSYTRSVYLAAAVGFLVFFILLLRRYQVKRVLLRTGFLLGVFVLLTYGMELALKQGMFQYAVARCVHFDLSAHLPLPHTWIDDTADVEKTTEETDATRDRTVEGLTELIKAHPLIGNGLGATSPLRDSGDEYFYLDMLARTGVIGLLLYLSPFLYALWCFVRAGWETRRQRPEAELLFLGLLPFLAATYFNPWMNAALGLAYYGLALKAAELLTAEARAEESA